MTTKCCQLNFLIMLNLANGAQSTSLSRHVISLSARAIQQQQQQLERCSQHSGSSHPLNPQLFPLRPVFPVFPSSRANNIVQIYRHLHGAWHWNCKLATHRERRWQHTLTHTHTYKHTRVCTYKMCTSMLCVVKLGSWKSRKLYEHKESGASKGMWERVSKRGRQGDDDEFFSPDDLLLWYIKRKIPEIFVEYYY